MNKKLLIASITASLAGFLFGFDTVVISGANLPIKQLWQTSEWFHGTFIMSMALWGTVVGALLAGIPTDKLGRKTTLIWIGVLYFVSAVGSGVAPDPYTFSFFRFILCRVEEFLESTLARSREHDDTWREPWIAAALAA